MLLLYEASSSPRTAAAALYLPGVWPTERLIVSMKLLGP
jgi:hypothetical protein